MAWQWWLTTGLLMLVMEGVLLALFPKQMRDAARQMASLPDSVLRKVGLVTLIVAACLLWLFSGGAA